MESYQRLCRLAEVITFAEGSPDDGQQRSAARALCEQLASNPSNLDKIGFRAGALCVGQHRRGNGILLAGTVLKTISEGNAHGTQVQLAASAQTVLVAGDSPLPAKEDDSVVILGSIVDDPAENLVGFKTKQPFVIWAGMTIKVE